MVTEVGGEEVDPTLLPEKLSRVSGSAISADVVDNPRKSTLIPKWCYGSVVREGKEVCGWSEEGHHVWPWVVVEDVWYEWQRSGEIVVRWVQETLQGWQQESHQSTYRQLVQQF